MKPTCVLISVLILTISTMAFAGPDDATEIPDGFTVKGERLDPSLFGPGIIESNEEVIARDRANPPPTTNSKTRNGEHGKWTVPSPRATGPAGSGDHYVMNSWGDTRMGISFPHPVHVHGANIGGQTNLEVTTSGLQIVGYLNGQEVARTDSMRGLILSPQWFEMNLVKVDRIVFESEPVAYGSGWFTLDDLTYSEWVTPGQPQVPTVIVDFDDLSYGAKLSGTAYRGLNWEQGSGPIPDEADGTGRAMPPPVSPWSGKQFGATSGEIAVDDEPLPLGPGSGPTLLAQYQGVFMNQVSGSGSFPPDTCGAIGPNHFAEVINSSYAVFNKNTGAMQQSMSLFSFFNGSGQNFNGGDPRILYDTHSGRWIVIGTNFGTTIHVAVSTSNSATGSYFKTFFTASAGTDAGCSVDYPTLGVDANGIYIGAFMVGCGLTIFAIDKAPMVAGTGLGTVTAFRGISTSEIALQGMQVYGAPVTPGGYFASVPSGSSSSIRFRRVNPPLSAPTLTTVATVSVNSYSSPPDAPVMGSTTPLDTLDSRIMHAVFRDGFFYATHTINISGRAAVRWYKFQLNAGSPFITLVQQGNISDPARHYYAPSLTANALGHMLMGFSGSKSDEFGSCYYAGRLVNDPAGQTTTPTLLFAGAASHNLIDSFGRNRWGDYSLTTVDPVDNDTLWTLVEYVHSTNTWGTRIGKFTFAPVDLTPPSPNPMTFSMPPVASSPTSIFMQATLATDVDSPPVNYFFDYVSGSGGHDSVQSSRDYTDTALPSANSAYTYRVAARDSATPNFNQTSFSSNSTAATGLEVPTGISFGIGTVTNNSVEVTADGSFTNLGLLQTGFFFEMTPAAGTGANVWVTGAGANIITVTGLSPCTQYGFRVKGRNYQGVEGEYNSPTQTLISTTGCTGCSLLGDLNGNTLIEGGDIAGFVHAKLGSPLPGTFPECANYGGTLETDVNDFVDDLLGL